MCTDLHSFSETLTAEAHFLTRGAFDTEIVPGVVTLSSLHPCCTAWVVCGWFSRHNPATSITCMATQSC
jgi:hypothetical protein